MSKTFRLVDPKQPATVVTKSPLPAQTNWNLCLICQEHKSDEPLSCPLQSTWKVRPSGYNSLAENLLKFSEMGELPHTIQLERLDEGHGIEAAMIANHAKYHHTCRLMYNNTKLKRAEKRALQLEDNIDKATSAHKYTRSNSQSPSAEKQIHDSCFFCEKPGGKEDLHEAATFKLDKQVRDCAELLGDMKLLSKLSGGDMIALEAKYHTTCLVQLYNRARKAKAEGSNNLDCLMRQVSESIAFAELVLYIDETVSDEKTAPVFKLADLVHLYQSRLEHLGVKLGTRVHSTRLKERLLAQFPDMRAQNDGKHVLLAFKEDIGAALSKVCDFDSDSDAVNLARAAQIVRRRMFSEAMPFSGFPKGCQEESVPPLLLALVNMILQGPSIKDQMTETSPAALSVAQLLKFNSIKHKRSQDTSSLKAIRHSTAQETPVPQYIGLMLHAHTRKRELVDRLSHLGLSICYDRVLRLSALLGNGVCQLFNREQVVCPPKMHRKVFTSAAVDNIDHNPSATTAKESFHGTAISLIQHPSFSGESVDRSILITEGPGNASTKTIGHLPHCYTDVPPVASSMKNLSVPSVSIETLCRSGFKRHTEEEYLWLHHAKLVVEDQCGSQENIAWAAFHANRQQLEDATICPTALLPLFQESAHTVAMIKHSFDVIKDAVHHLNPGQVPVIAFDQPLFALAKQIQWKWPDNYGEDKVVVMFGGLHIEMAALKTLGDWLKGSGWVEALSQAEIATPGTADSFLRVTHVTRTRRVHQITATALYILQHRAFEREVLRRDDTGDGSNFDEWCQQKRETFPQFQYWDTVLELELVVLVYVRSLRQSSFDMYLDALTELVPWFFALDHTNYARWIPIHLRDMADLTTRHQDVAKEFRSGNFTVKKTHRIFSAIPIDQAHEQNNACIKGDGGAVGLTDNPNALRRWMIAGPEVARIIDEFHFGLQHYGKQHDTKHHDQGPSVQAAFAKDVSSLVNVIEELGNPFEEESGDLIALHTKEIASSNAVVAVQNVKKIGQEQFKAFTKECIIDKTKAIDETIHRNKLKIFGASTQKSVNKGKQKLVSLKNDVTLFSRLYIGCQTRHGDLEEFFCYENQACPPALSDGNSLRLGTKSDILTCLEEISDAKTEAPSATSVVLDGAAIVQMLKPGTAKTFRNYAHEIFIPYLSTMLLTASRLDLIWDRYLVDSLKGSARAKRGKGIRRRVVATATIPSNWQNFLREDSNKTELFKFLSEAVFMWFDQEDKQLVIAEGEGVLSKPPISDTASLMPCNHEEADSRMFLHVYHAVNHGHHNVLIRTVDTDVVVLAVSMITMIQQEDKLWLAFGTGKRFRYLAAHEIANGLGVEKARALPMFHALTGCDTVSSFTGHGKKGAWAVWAVLPELTEALLQVSAAPADIPEDVAHTIERFVVLLFDRTSQCTDINRARMKLFAKKNNVQLIPPTKAALEEHIKRAVYQGGHVWGQILQPAPELPPPTNWGWLRTDDGLYEPHWTKLPEAAKTCPELVSCNCKKGCAKRCSCKKAELACTALCYCEGECSQS